MSKSISVTVESTGNFAVVGDRTTFEKRLKAAVPCRWVKSINGWRVHSKNAENLRRFVVEVGGKFVTDSPSKLSAKSSTHSVGKDVKNSQISALVQEEQDLDNHRGLEEDDPADGIQSEDESADESPLEDVPADVSQSEDESADESPLEDDPADESQSEDESADDSPLEDDPSDESSEDDPDDTVPVKKGREYFGRSGGKNARLTKSPRHKKNYHRAQSPERVDSRNPHRDNESKTRSKTRKQDRSESKRDRSESKSALYSKTALKNRHTETSRFNEPKRNPLDYTYNPDDEDIESLSRRVRDLTKVVAYLVKQLRDQR